MTEARIVAEIAETCAWIELFIGSERGNKGKEVLVNDDIVYMPGIVLAEIARKYLREGVVESVITEPVEADNKKLARGHYQL